MATKTARAADPKSETARYRGGLARSLVQTLLIFTFIPLTLMGGAAYLRARDLLRNQVVTQMRAQIADQVQQIDLTVKTKEIRLDRLVRGSDFLLAASRALNASPQGPDFEALRSDFVRILDSINPQGGRPTFNQYFLMGPTGTIEFASNPAWEGQSLRDLPIYKSLSESDHQSFTAFNPGPLYPNQLVLLTISQVRSSTGATLGTLVGVTESQELRTILQNLATPGSGAEAMFVTPDGAVIGADPYTNEMKAIAVPPSEVNPIMAALGPMMKEEASQPASVQFTDQEGARAFGQVTWLNSLGAGIVYEIDESRVFGALSSLVPFTLVIFVASLAAMGVVLSIGANRVFRPLVSLADITKRFSEGDFAQRAEVRTKDEIGLLAQSFNRMAEDLSGLYRSLEQKVEERTRQMRTAAAVAERITSTANLNELLNRTVQLLVEQFNFYQASVFLLDRSGRSAVLQASYGPAAEKLLSRGHRLEVGSASIIGWVTANNQPRIASDVAEDPMHLKNELLPETRSETGIPIAAGGLVLGALDVQSTEPAAFGPETLVMLRTLSNQLAAAIQNMTLVEASQTNLQEVERLHSASRQIVAAQTRQEALSKAAAVLVKAVYPALVLAVRGGRLELVGRGDPDKPELVSMLLATPVLETRLGEIDKYMTGGTAIVEGGSLGVPAPLAEFTRQTGYRAVAFLPVLHGQELAGLVIIGSPKRPLSKVLIEPYESVVDLINTTLDRIAESDDKGRQLSERAALASIGQAITRTAGNLGGFFGELHTQIRRNIGDYAFVVALYDPATESISVPYAYQEGRVEKIDSFPLGEGLTSILIRTRQPLLLTDDVERRGLKMGAKMVGRPAQSWMGAPMIVQDMPVGALMLQDLERENAFDERHLRFFVELANQVAAVVYSARLLDQSRTHAFQLETAAEIARDISGSLNLDDLLSKTVKFLQERFGYYHAGVFLLDPRREYAVIREATGEAGAQMKRMGHRLAVGSRSIVGFVAGRGEPLIVNDTSKDATYYANPLLPGTRSEAAIPLQVGERIVGVMDVQSTHPYAFREDDVRTLRILADQLAVAVVNSELFAETQEHLSQHRLLHHITTSAASGTTLDEALQSAVSGLQVTLGGDRVSILLADRENRALEVKAAAGYSEDIMRLRIPTGAGITGWSAAHRRALRVDDVVDDARYIQASANTKSELAVPLIYRNEVLGVLNVESEQLAAYTEDDEEMLGTLAGSLAAIIANARLLEQVRAQAERERALFEITGKIRRAPDMQSILATTASELTKAVGARHAQIKVSGETNSGDNDKEKR